MYRTILMLALALMINGCGSEPAAKKKTTAKPKKALTKTEELHRKARLTEAASIIGYDGKRIRKNLDNIIDQNAKHQKMLEGIGDL